MEATVSNVPAADASVRADTRTGTEAAAAPVLRPAPARMTRLLCARIYLYGLWASVPAAFHVTRPMFAGRDPGIGYDKRMVLFHALQSAGLSLLFAVPALALLWPASPGEGGEAVPLTEPRQFTPWALLLLALFKVGVLNPVLARVYFGERGAAAPLRIPGLAWMAERLARWLLPPQETEGGNASYFAGDRPFTGYGTEINAWTVVIDTSAPSQSLHDFSGVAQTPTPLDPSDLYRAIVGCSAALQADTLNIGWHTFLQGTAANEQRQRIARRFARPPHRLSPQTIDALDRDGESGRRYMLLTMEKASLDLVATQFVRFQANGKLMFCEFASYVLAPGLERLYRLDRLFRAQPLVYGLFGLALGAAAALLACALVVGLGLMLPGLGWVQGSALLVEAPELLPALLLGHLAQPGTVPLSLGLVAVAWAGVFLGWRLLRGAFGAVALLARLSNQFGVAYSYRERFTSRGNLDYFCLQDVARFMKTQEKILVKAICDQLRSNGIDASDLKDSLTAYINQGVINSGDIRGNVLTSVKSFMFRRPARAAANRTKRKAVNA